MTAALARSLWDYDSETGMMTWRVKPCPKVRVGDVAGSYSKGYLKGMYKGKKYLVHRLAWLIVTGSWPVNEIDHINGVRDDNRLVNLRDVTARENLLNMRRHREGQLRYVTFHKPSGKWHSRTPQIDGKRKYLGLYGTMQEANAVAEQWIKDNLSEEDQS
jgi:hypothetical protein